MAATFHSGGGGKIDVGKWVKLKLIFRKNGEAEWGVLGST